MASFSDLNIPDNAWVDIYAVTGASTSATLLIQNTGAYNLMYFESASAPLATSMQGFIITPNSPIKSVVLKSGEKAYVKTFNSSTLYSESGTLAVMLG